MAYYTFLCSKTLLFCTGLLSLAVEGPSETVLKFEGTLLKPLSRFDYEPLEPGKYQISVKFDDKHISGSPFTANIVGMFINL